jgi:ABC-2 type transport system permease protein
MTEFSLANRVRAILSVAIYRFRLASRYPGWLILDIVLPIFLAAMPILLGQAVSGGSALAAQNFARNTGTPSYAAYLLIGSNIFMIVSGAFWQVGMWLRREMQTGTLEAIYLMPTGRGEVLAGIALFGTVRSLLVFVIAFGAGSIIFGINPLQGDIGLAVVFILLGTIPLYGLSLLYGALIIKIKEANSLVNLAQWVVSFLMGLYFPITVFPPLLRIVAQLFPPTWMVNGVRASLLDVGYFFERWYFDLGVLFAFSLVTPMLGYWLFLRTERGVKRNEGIGEF